MIKVSILTFTPRKEAPIKAARPGAPRTPRHGAPQVAASRLMFAVKILKQTAPQPLAKMHRRDTAPKNIRNVGNCQGQARECKICTRVAKLINFEFYHSPTGNENKNVFAIEITFCAFCRASGRFQFSSGRSGSLVRFLN